MSLQTPVAFFVFNRPDLTEQVFAAIARAQPRRLLVVADGPRHEAETQLCREARAIIERIDWPCECETLFSVENLGCRARISSGLEWVFSRVESAIVLEDDCLPSPSFFPFCEAMLTRFRDDERVMHISGDNFAPLSDSSASYGFSRYVHAWGWATWRRAWQHYDVDMAAWPDARASILEACANAREAKFWDERFSTTWRGEVDSWDFQWVFACWRRGGLSVVPRVNLVSNLGFRRDATHNDPSYTCADSGLSQLPALELRIENHPREVIADARADKIERQRLIHPPRPLWPRLMARMRRELGQRPQKP